MSAGILAMSRCIARGAAIGAVVALLSGCATAPSPQPPPAHTRMMAAAKAALARAPSLEAAAIDVTVEQGALTLDGFVASKQQRERAARVAATGAGVELEQVANRLRIK
ncbi:MAG: BON domain-containing protein [Gammaproteobacteria bacterium]